MCLAVLCTSGVQFLMQNIPANGASKGLGPCPEVPVPKQPPAFAAAVPIKHAEQTTAASTRCPLLSCAHRSTQHFPLSPHTKCDWITLSLTPALPPPPHPRTLTSPPTWNDRLCWPVRDVQWLLNPVTPLLPLPVITGSDSPCQHDVMGPQDACIVLLLRSHLQAAGMRPVMLLQHPPASVQPTRQSHAQASKTAAFVA